MGGGLVIERAEINSFGCLSNRIIEPQAGLNIFNAPNESGKSTFAQFLKFIFYGFAGTRSQNVAENEKTLYTPWSSPVSSGTVYYSINGKRYKTERTYMTNGRETLKTVDLTNGAEVFKGVEPGEAFFGLGEAVFAKTAFFRQLAVPDGKDEKTAAQLQNLSRGADGDGDAESALKKLNQAKLSISGSRRGAVIPKLTELENDYSRRLELSIENNKRQEEIVKKIKNADRLINESARELEKLYAEKENTEIYEICELLKRYAADIRLENEAEKLFREKQSALKTGTEAESAELKDLNRLNQEFVLLLKEKNRTAETLEKEEKEHAEAENKTPEIEKNLPGLKRKHAVINGFLYSSAAIGLLLAAAGAAMIFIGGLNTDTGIVLTCLSLPCLAVLARSFFNRRSFYKAYGVKNSTEYKINIAKIPLLAKKLAEQRIDSDIRNAEYSELCGELENVKKQLDAGIEKYISAEKATTYREQIDEIDDASRKLLRARENFLAIKQTNSGMYGNADIENLKKRASVGARKPERPKKIIENEIRFHELRIEENKKLRNEHDREKAVLEGSAGDIQEISAKLKNVKEKLKKYNAVNSSLETAAEVLNEACDHMKSIVSPALAKYAGDFFAKATGGKYTALNMDTKLAMTFEDTENNRKPAEFLSAGTRDSAYLSLRMALIKLLYGAAAPFIVLDDVFVRLDKDRLENILRLLEKLAEDYQIFIISCGGRETDYYNERNIRFNAITI